MWGYAERTHLRVIFQCHMVPAGADTHAHQTEEGK